MDRLERAKRKRKQDDLKSKSDNESRAKRNCPCRQSLDTNLCIFSGRLHQFSTLQSDASVRSMAKDLQDASFTCQD